ncbi:MAG: hypothetical protein COZ31_07760 [Nitrospirae bacterium CG_4_10_14_3_um_filter_44_29]|nr:hypothetical protein [Nitrospirota bacterium]OIO29564.1 MAG: hypothetical protein AUJ60_04700 [Nitrospirae bacterium CG1_02_44_142]PIV40546.1 MAG: hypothetical protein COS28_08345 [Nitrospirae bacterium CG02_land_8_20_14_3_00_44_33]PIX87946.1 MAG: hypothetical protein COZ31_07760 [Nitrospirae bacterium CG_4_10_14_3_um_filter_44_29]PJA83077.1 MAG: hypothetical protein CO147_02825 [Nitrospirae bacterium CG_4_9_14_3_um_filter_44_28]
MKLGEVLVKEGLITKEHLRLALERQVIFGGRLGTNIVELGILKEDEFAKFLSRYLKIPVADPSQLANIDEETISAISKEMAEKYKAIPFKKDKNRLHMAMLDPKDMKAVDDFRFISGYDVIPYAASELRILYALEKYYGIKRDLRYISIFDRIEEEKQVVVTDSEELKKIKQAFANVTEKEEIAGILISEAQKAAKRAALFIVKGNGVSGWKAKGLTVEGISINALSSGGASIFNDVLVKKAYYRGPVLKLPGNEELIKILSGTPQDSLTIPISIRERAVALLYADNGNDAVLDANVNYLNTLGSMASMAFEILILRKKIMDM